MHTCRVNDMVYTREDIGENISLIEGITAYSFIERNTAPAQVVLIEKKSK